MNRYMIWVRRATLVLVLVAINVPLLVVPIFVRDAFVPHPENTLLFGALGGKISSSTATNDSTLPQPVYRTRAMDLVVASIIVTLFLFVDVFIVWLLARIGGKLAADMRAVIRLPGANLWVKGAGLMGSFLAIASLGLGAVYILAK